MDHYSSFSHGPSMSWNNHISQLSRTHSLMSATSSGSSLGSRESVRTNLIVNYLPNNMTENELYALFVTIGPIESCRVMRDIKTGYSYGFGFVNYMSEDHAIRAITTLNGYQVQNKRLKVSFARPSGEDIKDTNLYVTNLPRTITEYQLDVIFGKYGNIVQKHILRDKLSGMPKGIAFVRYDKREEAQEAISALNNVIPDGGSQPLGVRLADEHGGRIQTSRAFSFAGGGGGGGGPGSYYSGSALSLTGAQYGGNASHSGAAYYGASTPYGGGMGGLGAAYRAGYTGSLNRGDGAIDTPHLYHDHQMQQLPLGSLPTFQPGAMGAPLHFAQNVSYAANLYVPEQAMQPYVYGGYVSYYN